MDFLFVFLRIYLIEKNKVSENDRLLLALVQKMDEKWGTQQNIKVDCYF